jgi:hypothetical protein
MDVNYQIRSLEIEPRVGEGAAGPYTLFLNDTLTIAHGADLNPGQDGGVFGDGLMKFNPADTIQAYWKSGKIWANVDASFGVEFRIEGNTTKDLRGRLNIYTTLAKWGRAGLIYSSRSQRYRLDRSRRFVQGGTNRGRRRNDGTC